MKTLINEGFLFYMRAILKWYRFLNTLSVDVALGAVVSCQFLCSVFDVNVSWVTLLSLGLVVWLIYTIDHLLDARRMKMSATTPRHQFHSENYKFMAMLSGVVGAGTGVLVLSIDPDILRIGLVLAFCVLVYFAMLRKLSVAKELVGALIYFFGVMVPVIAKRPVDFYHETSGVLFFLIVLTNLILFSWFDHGDDSQQGHATIATRLGYKNTQALLRILFSLVGLYLVFTLYNELSLALGVTFSGMYLLLLIVFLFPDWQKTEERYRLIGDFAFFIPLFYLLSQ